MMDKNLAANHANPKMITPALHSVRWLVTLYSLISWLTVAAIIILSYTAPNLVNPEAWVRGIIVAATSVLTVVFANRAAIGKPRALMRLRIVVTVLLVAFTAVLFFLTLPVWMKVEQVVCSVLLLVIAILIFKS
ncbi:hypothetical protein LOZ80_03740 [Paenibacillus sp. HWE-109]|uniref:hypothetical protein n=1 Tax=Paenibacillus sp. HWE-109 TaxID=1306526 RepID=UPI001EDF573C|nr:hypothetical protein [Paenibacillus sp. HWE-109]UKS28063.1 hypothetical protein LOZ80_03740 [Paenibacillus sp. HWE-109]